MALGHRKAIRIDLLALRMAVAPIRNHRKSKALLVNIKLECRNMSVLISLLITFLVIILVLWLVQQLPVEGRIKQIIQIVVIIIGIVSLLKYLAVF